MTDYDISCEFHSLLWIITEDNSNHCYTSDATNSMLLNGGMYFPFTQVVMTYNINVFIYHVRPTGIHYTHKYSETVRSKFLMYLMILMRMQKMIKCIKKLWKNTLSRRLLWWWWTEYADGDGGKGGGGEVGYDGWWNA